MRLDSRNGDKARCYDAKRCCEVVDVVAVDDQTAQWIGVVSPRQLAADGSGYITEVHQEDRITIYRDKGLVIFNEVDDPSPIEVTDVREVIA